MSSVENLFESFKGAKALIIGDVMVDSYIWGKVDRISPEAPVPVVHAIKREKRLGGAANVALNVLALGATPILCSIIGDDKDGNDFIQIMKTRGMQTRGIIQSDKRITTLKERILSGSQHMLRVDTESNLPLQALEERSLTQLIGKLIPESDVIIFEDYDKGTITSDIIIKTIEIAKAHNIPVVVDPKKVNFLNYKGVTLFKPNLKELREGLKMDIDPSNEADIQLAVGKLREELDAEQVLVTLSEKGLYYDTGKEKTWIPAHIRLISDVSGAGDTVISIAAIGLAVKMPAKQLAALANLGGGLVCEYIGVVPVPKDRLMEEAIKKNILE
jgi:D-glycero-beta-D-manno-heptose-7-phosphate kinase